MTDQQLFDRVVRAIVKQGEKSLDQLTHACMYRTSAGLKCAAGHLILDEAYCEEIEGCSVDIDADGGSDKYFLIKQVLFESGVDHDQLELVSSLQAAHDLADSDSFVYSFTQRAKKIAEKLGLKFPKNLLES